MHVTRKYNVTLDAALTRTQRATDLLIARTLDDLYWVMSYSRWKDERYWPAFRDALLREHPSLTQEGLCKAREFNFQLSCRHSDNRIGVDFAGSTIRNC